MKILNKGARDILQKHTVHACTDVSGFGLGGHGTEMAEGSDKTLGIYTEQLPVLPDVEEYASMGLIPAGAYRNREFAGKSGFSSSAVLWREDLVFFDPPDFRRASCSSAGRRSREYCQPTERSRASRCCGDRRSCRQGRKSSDASMSSLY